MSTPGSAPTSPLSDPESHGFPPGVRVERLAARTVSSLAPKFCECWAVTRLPAGALLGWAECPRPGGLWSIVSQPFPDAPATARPSLFDTAPDRARAFFKLAELARITVAPKPLDLSEPQVPAGPIPLEPVATHTITIGGVAYRHRLLRRGEADELCEGLEGVESGEVTGGHLVAAMRVMRAVLPPSAVEDLRRRLEDETSDLTTAEVIAALGEIVKRSKPD